MKDKEIISIISDIQASPKECEWIEIKCNNKEPHLIGEYISALANGAAYVGQSRGYLAYGIDDSSHTIVGTDFQPKSEKIGNEELENWLAVHLAPRIDFSINEIAIEGKHIVLFVIDSAGNTPVKFDGTAYIRVGSYKKKLSDHPERERKIWQNTKSGYFETKTALSGVSSDEVLSLIDYPSFFRLMDIPLPENKNAILEKLAEEKIIVKRQTCYDITNLGGILFATNLNSFDNLSRKAVRVVFYKGNSRIDAIREQVGAKGYAVGFEGLVEYISANLPSNEEIGKAFRKDTPMYPPIAIREFVANALIHQDFSIGGASVMIEVFADRIEITNPGNPLIDVLRFIDHAPISRNEKLASMMRRLKICEERGSGIDRAITQCEIHQLPAPDFQKGDLFTRVTMIAPQPMGKMTKDDKVRACYQHCCLQYLSGNKMTNESFRGRLNISDKNYSIASRIISETVARKLIKPDESSRSRKYAQYLPVWA